MRICFTWDDGALEDQKLFELHQKYELPGMFFVPTENSEGRKVLSPEAIRANHSKLISFGGHTRHHVYLTRIPLRSVQQEVRDNRLYLENLLGEKVPHFCLPGGQYTKEILQEVYNEYQTIRTADTMCFHSEMDFKRPSFHMYPRGKRSLLVNGLKMHSLAQTIHVAKNIRSSYWEILRNLLGYEATHDASGEVIIWGHSWEIEELDLWSDVEDIFKIVSASYKQQCVSYDVLCNKSV